MSNDKNDPAFPMYSEIGNLHSTGLTKREFFTLIIYAAQTAGFWANPEIEAGPTMDEACEYADELLDVLKMDRE